MPVDLRIQIQALLQGNGIQASAEQVTALAAGLERASSQGADTEKRLQEVIRAAQDLGRDTSGLETQLQALRNAQSEGILNAYIAELKESIEVGKSAGAEVSDLEEKLKAITTSTEDATAAGRNNAEELRRQAALALFYQTSTKDATRTTTNLGGEIRELAKAGRGAREAVEGLEQGGIYGLGRAAKGVAEIIKAFASTTLGAVLIPVVAAAGTALAILKSRLNENAEAMKKTFEEAAKAAEDYKQRQEETSKAVVATLQQQQQAVAAVVAQYTELLGLIDAAEKRNKGLGDARRAAEDAKLNAEEQAALAKAAPDQRDAVSLSFRRRREDVALQRDREDATNAELQAGVRKQNAEEQLARLRSEQDSLNQQLREAKDAAAAALAKSQQEYIANPSSPAAMAARNEARVKADAAARLEAESRLKAEQAAAAVNQQAEASNVLEQSPFRRQALDQRARALELQRAREDRDAEIAARERSREEALNFRTSSAGASIELLSGGIPESRVGKASPKISEAATRVRDYAKALRDGATGDELEQLSAALAELLQATQGIRSQTLAELSALKVEIEKLKGAVTATRVK